LAVSNEIKNLAATLAIFALPKPPELSRPRRTALADRDRRRASIFQPITTFVFPEDNVAPLGPAPALRAVPDEARQANAPGRDLWIAALGPRRWRPGLDAKTERSQRVVKI
jgi:hypothetical protein